MRYKTTDDFVANHNVEVDNCILVGANRKYAFALGTLILNLIDFVPDNYQIIAMHDDIPTNDLDILESISKNIILIEFNENYFLDKLSLNDFNKSSYYTHYSHMAFARYEMFKLLHKYKKLLWLDCDILVRDKFYTIFDNNQITLRSSKASIATACGDPTLSQFGCTFNTGVFFTTNSINYANLYEQAYKLTAEKIETLRLADQGILSYLLKVNNIPVKPLSREYNNFHPYDDLKAAKIIHSCGSRHKLWNSNLFQLVLSEYKYYYEKWIRLKGSRRDSDKSHSGFLGNSLGEASSALDNISFLIHLYNNIALTDMSGIQAKIDINSFCIRYFLVNTDNTIFYRLNVSPYEVVIAIRDSNNLLECCIESLKESFVHASIEKKGKLSVFRLHSDSKNIKEDFKRLIYATKDVLVVLYKFSREHVVSS